LEKRLQDLQSQIYVEQTKAKLQITKGDIARYIKKAIAAEPAALVRLLVKQIVLFDDKVEIELNYTSGGNKGAEAVTVYETTKEFEVEKHLLHVKPTKAKMKIKIKV